MKILLCTSEFGNGAGGLAFHCSQLRYIFEKLGHTVYVEILLNNDGYKIIDGGYDQELSDKIRIAYKLKLMSEIYSSKIDLCISCGAGMTSYKAMLFCKKNKIPLGIVLCGSEMNLACGKADLAYYNLKSSEYASYIIGISKELVENAKLYIESLHKKYYIIPIAYNFDINDISNNQVKRTDGSLIFATGSAFIGEKKGISNLILAFSNYIKKIKRNDKLYIYGKIDEDIKLQYLDIINENNLNNNVLIFGYLSRQEFISKLSEIDIYIQASPFEGCGISVLEAIKAGKEILISNSGFIAETIRDEYPNHIIKSLETNKFAQQLCYFAENVYKIKKNEKIKLKMQKILSENKIMTKWNEVLNYIPVNEKLKDDNFIAVMFHDINNSYTGIDYAIDGFEKLLNIVFQKGYKLCSVRKYFESVNKENLIVCTFDDGYENVYKNAFPIMEQYGFSATVFLCPDLIGKNNSWNHRDDANRRHLTHKMILELVKSGWEIGSHGLSHINLLRLSEHELNYTLSESKKLLQEYGVIDTFCYPYGIFNLYIKNMVKKYYTKAFSVTVGSKNYKYDPFQITRLTPEDLLKLFISDNLIS